jgi:APA family basic amino acid/polyamine antiporter
VTEGPGAATPPKPSIRRDAFITIERRVGVPQLFGTAYSTVGSSIYFALGVVAAYALGLTPLVFLVAGLLFVLTTLTYFEGMTLHPERGGSAVMARYAFNELVSFIAGWAILLDFTILIAISAVSIGHYLTAFWTELGSDVADLLIAFGVLGIIARYNLLGRAPRGRRTLALAVVDILLLLMIVAIGLAASFDPGAITDSVSVGSVPEWSDLVFGMTIAVIAYTGIEAAANLAPEVRVPRQALRKTVGAGAVAVLTLFVGMSVVALMALPVQEGVPVAADTGSSFGTDLGGRWIESPVLGVVEAISSGVAGELLSWVVAIVATLVLAQAANAGMVGIARTAYTLATHRQIPRGVARLHERHGTPWIVILAFTVLAAALVVPLDFEFLAGLFAYGALIAFAIAHLSVCRMRFTEPERQRAYRVPFNVRLRGRDLPLPAALGAALSIVGWGATFFLHDDARLFGTVWMAAGLVFYVAYRRREGLSLTGMVEVPAARMSHLPRVDYGNILVPVFGEALDDDIMSTAGQLASERRGDTAGGARILAIYVLEMPMSLPLDAPVPPARLEHAERALARAKRVGEEYAGVEVTGLPVRGRTVGSAIVEQARVNGVELIVIGAEPPSRVRGGGVLGGIAGSAPRELGDVTAYVLEKAPTRVLITAPPEAAGAERADEALEQRWHPAKLSAGRSNVRCAGRMARQAGRGIFWVIACSF